MWLMFASRNIDRDQSLGGQTIRSQNRMRYWRVLSAVLTPLLMTVCSSTQALPSLDCREYYKNFRTDPEKYPLPKVVLFLGELTGRKGLWNRARQKGPRIYDGQDQAGYKEIEIKLNAFLSEFGLTLDRFLELREGDDPINSRLQDVFQSVSFDKFLSDRDFRVIRAPNGDFYVSDGNHLFTAYRMLGVQQAMADVYADCFESKVTYTAEEMAHLMSEFEDYARANNLLRLTNSDGKELHLEDLQQKMRDYPFRSLAWLLMQSGVIAKVRNVDFLEFKWGEFLENQFKEKGWYLKFHDDHQFILAFDRALRILYTMENTGILESLPGYIKPSKREKKRLKKMQKAQQTCDSLIRYYRKKEKE